jgi:tetratricopeptide (TPR) repeat protein
MTSGKKLLRLVFLLASASLVNGAALANGGGMSGGGGMPSATRPSFNPATEYQKGLDALNANDFKTAAGAFDRVLSVAPRNVQTLVVDGFAKAGMNDFNGARDAYKKALSLDDKNIMAHRGYALAMVSLGDKDGATKELKTLKDRAAACGGTCAEASDLNAAVSAVESATSGTPGKQSSIAPPSLLFGDAKSGDHAYVTAVALINEHRYPQALRSLEKAEAIFGPHPDVLTYIGYTYRKMGQYDRAERYYREALSIAPNHRGATEYYGELKVERGDIKGARLMLAKLDSLCSFGCVDAEVLRQWIVKGHE